MFIAVDFDGTIVRHDFPSIGPPCPGAFAWLLAFKTLGAKLILWTMRSGVHSDEAVEFCKARGLDFDLVNENPQDWTDSPKAYAEVYIDDAAIGCPVVFPHDGGRAFVDWSTVGPSVAQMIVLNMENDLESKPN